MKRVLSQTCSILLTKSFFVCVCLGRNEWWTSSGLPSGWSLLLPFSSRIIWFCFGRPGSCCYLHCLHARLLCLLLQDLDWGLRILRQRCKSVFLCAFLTCLITVPREINLPISLCVSQVAKQLKEQQMVMRGHRETSMVHELNRYKEHNFPYAASIQHEAWDSMYL